MSDPTALVALLSLGSNKYQTLVVFFYVPYRTYTIFLHICELIDVINNSF